MTLSVAELAEALGLAYEGDGEQRLEGVAPLESAGPTDLAFARDERLAGGLAHSKAGACIAPEGVDVGGRPVLRSPAPGLHFGRAARLLQPPAPAEPGVAASAQVDPSAAVDPTASVGPWARVGPGSRIGAGSVLGAGVVLGAEVRVGRDCRLEARVVVGDGTRIGDRCQVQPGAVLGGVGFGYGVDEGGDWEHMPQLGIVVLEDDVDVGANTTIDRATLGQTRIGRGTKIDNLVQIAHNCDIGERCLIAAQVGIAGSSRLGERVMMMGQSAVSDHVEVGEGSFVGARCAVHNDIPAGSRVWGTPQLEERRWARSVALFARLPELARRIRALEKHLGLRPKR